MNRSRGGFDVVFTLSDRIIGFNLAHALPRGGFPAKPAVMSSQMSPGRLDEEIRNADLPRVIDNLDAGMGYSRRLESVPNGYAYTMPGYTRAPGAVFMPAGKLTEIAMPAITANLGKNRITGSEFFDGAIYLRTLRNQVLKIEPDGASATISATFGADWYGYGMAVFNNRLYVAGTTAGLAYKTAGGGWSAANPGVQRQWLVTTTWRPQGIPTQVMLSIAPDYNWSGLVWCPITADPMDGASWSAPVPVGPDRARRAGPIIAAPRHAYVYARDGIYDVDELGVRAFNIAPWIGENVDSWNGIWGMHVGGGAYYAHSQGLAYVPTNGETQTAPEWAQPGWGLPYEGPMLGVPTAGTLEGGWGMLGLLTPPVYPPNEDSTAPPGYYSSYIVAGRRDPGGPGGGMAYGQASHIWHGVEAVLPGMITHMRVYTTAVAAGWPRLLICTTDEANPSQVRAFWMSLSKVGTPLQEMIWGGQFQPADAASLFLPADSWNRPSSVKQLLQLDMVTERLNVNSDYLKVYASADAGASASATWADQGLAEEGTYTSLQPSDVTQGRFLSTRVDAVGHPILRSLELRAALGVQLREARTYQFVLAWDNALKGARSRETADPERRLADLHALMGQVCLLDDGASGGPSRVRVLQVLPAERRQLGGAQRAGAHGAEGAWAIVVGVTVSFLDTPFRWDGHAGDQFDRERSWS